MGGRLLQVTGYLQREGIVVYLIAQDIQDMSHRLSELGHPMGDAVGQTLPQADDTGGCSGWLLRCNGHRVGDPHQS